MPDEPITNPSTESPAPPSAPPPTEMPPAPVAPVETPPTTMPAAPAEPIPAPPMAAPETIAPPAAPPPPAFAEASAGKPTPESPIRSLLDKALAKIQFRKQAKLEKIMVLAKSKGQVTNDDAQKLLRVSDATASRYLAELVKAGRLRRTGSLSHSSYQPIQ